MLDRLIKYSSSPNPLQKNFDAEGTAMKQSRYLYSLWKAHLSKHVLSQQFLQIQLGGVLQEHVVVLCDCPARSKSASAYGTQS